MVRNAEQPLADAAQAHRARSAGHLSGLRAVEPGAGRSGQPSPGRLHRAAGIPDGDAGCCGRRRQRAFAACARSGLQSRRRPAEAVRDLAHPCIAARARGALPRRRIRAAFSCRRARRARLRVRAHVGRGLRRDDRAAAHLHAARREAESSSDRRRGMERHVRRRLAAAAAACVGRRADWDGGRAERRALAAGRDPGAVAGGAACGAQGRDVVRSRLPSHGPAGGAPVCGGVIMQRCATNRAPAMMMTEPESRPPLDDGAATMAPSKPTAPVLALDAERVRPYIPRTVQQHLADDPDSQSWIAEGTAAFVDISGFTQLSEQLARKGREGAEQITDVVGGSFESILAVAYQNEGGLLKFGGDALLLWFHGEDHAERACRATVLMRRVLEDVGRIELPGAQVTLQMSQGVHSGQFHFFAVGTAHIEFLPVGPAWSRLAALEREAGGGEILISAETAALVPAECVGAAKGPGLLLQKEPPGETGTLKLTEPPAVPPETLVRCLSPAIRTHVLGGGGMPEHRPVTIAFIRFEGTDALIEDRGVPATAEALHKLVSAVETAVEEQGVSFLASDVDADGGKLILTGGAPKITGNDEERMLLALTRIAASDLPLPIRIGVHRGAVFAGDIGPKYRRTYTVMGDAVNLTARLMAKAEPGKIYATGDVLERSTTQFETTKLEPFVVKGKAEPVQAWSVGRAQSSKARQVLSQRLP
ncbi:MAG: adenylate/guanylate cyclase domain-containing protein, partial [Betaproteobacteria bacterium]